MNLAELVQRAVRPRVATRFEGLIDTVPNDDGIENSAEQVESVETIGGLSIIIEYTDAKGDQSQRMITCRKLSVRAGKDYINAYCHHRRCARSFRIDRITDIFDAQTGESLSPAQAFFASYEPDSRTKSGLSWGLSVGRKLDLIAFLNALVFIARCDGEFHSSERASLEQALTSFWLRLEIPEDANFDEVLDYADKLAPDGETFWAALHRFKEDPTLQSIFLRHVNLLIQADQVVVESETQWLIEIADFFG